MSLGFILFSCSSFDRVRHPGFQDKAAKSRFQDEIEPEMTVSEYLETIRRVSREFSRRPKQSRVGALPERLLIFECAFE